MQLTAPGKLAALIVVIIGCFGFILFGTGDTTPAWAAITLITGYLIGNGTGASRGVATAAVWSPPPDHQPPPHL